MPGPDSNSIQPIKAGADSRHNWKTINQCIAHLSSLTRSDADRRAAIAELRRIRKDALGEATAAEVQMFRFKSSQQDYITCRSWDGSTEGSTDIYIAKPFKLRGSLTSATIDGDTVTYGSYGADYTTREATNDGQTEKQVIVPRFLENDVLYAVSVEGGTGVSRSGTELTLLDINACGRAWARKYDQS